MLSAFAFGLLGILPGFLPPISPEIIRLGAFGALLAVLVSLLNWRSYTWWARLALGVIMTLQFLAIASRSWWILVGFQWIWVAPMFLAYLVAWLLPLLRPRISDVLWREQTAPQTRIGRTILAIALGIGPSAGVIGASLGMFGYRTDGLRGVLLAGGAICSLVSIGFAFALGYQLWPERPWAAMRGSQEGNS